METLRLNETAAREMVLVRAIESEDSDSAILTKEDRQFASVTALRDRPLGEGVSPGEVGAYLARRAELALGRLVSRYPALKTVCGLSRWPHWLSWAVPLLAFAAGLATNVLDGPRLNVLAFPLLGMIAWNLLVYLWLAWSSLTPRRERRPLVGLFERRLHPAGGRLAGQPTLERGVTRFASDWTRIAGPLTRARASRTLHLGAALFAVGVLASMLARARYTADYSAGWAGTWAGAELEVASLLGVILGPASWLTGIELPTAERLRELRGGAESAGNWLILWTVTAALFVVLPRVLLAFASASRSALLKRRLPVPGREDFYVRGLLRNALGQPGSARVVPYGLQLPSRSRDRLERLLVQALGEKMRVRVDEAVPYGAEDRWLAEEGANLCDCDHLVLLFGMGSTPEAENHGAFATGVRDRLAGKATGLTLLLEESGLRALLAGQPSAARRLEERLGAWTDVLAPVGISPVAVSLDSGEDEAGARLLERALQRTPVPA